VVFVLLSNDVFCTSPSKYLGYVFVTLIKMLHYRIVTTRGNSSVATVPRKIGATSRIIFRF